MDYRSLLFYIIIFFVFIIPTTSFGAVVLDKSKVAINEGLFAWWSFDEIINQQIVDKSPAKNNLNVGANPNRTNGVINKGFNFSGSTAYYPADGSYINNYVDNFTISFWALPTGERNSTTESTNGVSGTSNQRYVLVPSHGDSTPTGGDAGVGISVGTNGISVFEHAGGHLPSTLVYDTTITDWTMVSIVVKDKQARLYLNGQLAHVGLTSASEHVFPGNGIGGFSYGYYAGKLDEFRMYGRALSSREIEALFRTNGNSYQQTSVSINTLLSSSSLIAYYTFDGKDISGDHIKNVADQNYSATRYPELYTETIPEGSWIVSGITNPDPESWEWMGDYEHYNGIYQPYGTVNGQTAYQKDGSHYLYYATDGYTVNWVLNSTVQASDPWFSDFMLEGDIDYPPTLPNSSGYGGGWNSWLYEYGMPNLSFVAPSLNPINVSWSEIGKIGQAMTFNGTDEYVRSDTDDLDTLQAGTISAWIKTTEGGTILSYSARTTTGAANIGWYCDLSINVCRQEWQTPIASWGALTTENANVFDGSWHHIAFVADGTNLLKIYIDGVAKTVVNDGAPEGNNSDFIADVKDINSTANNLQIGAGIRNIDNTPNVYLGGFNGSIDDVRIYNRALTNTEIKDLYQKSANNKVVINQSQNNKNSNGLVGLWSFNGQDISETTAYDRSGNGNNAEVPEGAAAGWLVSGAGESSYNGLYTQQGEFDDGNIGPRPWYSNGTRYLFFTTNNPVSCGWILHYDSELYYDQYDVAPPYCLQPTNNDQLPTEGTWEAPSEAEPAPTVTLQTAASGSLKNQVTIGKVGQALHFNGDNEMLFVPHFNFFTGNHDYTYTLWMNTEQYLDPGSDAVLLWYGGQSANAVAGLSIKEDKITSLHYADDKVFSFIPSLNKWYYVTLVYTATNREVKLYIDGILQETLTHTNPLNISTNSLGIGGDTPDPDSRRFKGKLDEVRIYDRALSAPEVMQLYKGK